MAIAVVKIGSVVLAPRGTLDRGAVARLAREVLEAESDGWRIVVVSSGAIACGLGPMGLREAPARIMDRQAAAAVGQQRLMAAWSEAFDAAGGRTVAQVLLTSDDIEHRARFLNARHTIERLLRAGVTPITNENDSVSFDEIRVGDNDRLGSLVAVAVGADRLVMLSSVDGLQDRTGRVVETITQMADARALIRRDTSPTGVGGMATKLDAAEIARENGVGCVIAPGGRPGALRAALRGEPVGTMIPAVGAGGRAARKRWIGYSIRARGEIHIDAGAVAALRERGASLLPSGIVAVTGEFEQGAVVELVGPDQTVVARGLASYAAGDLRRIAGRRAEEISGALGYSYCDEAVHRDDLVLIGGHTGASDEREGTR